MIELPSVDRPTVSVVMVVYGGWEWVRKALVALLENTEPCYEVVIVDNASPDGTALQLSAEVSGAIVVLNESNFGFGPGANQGALHAVGRHLLFLNSDAFVQPGWLPPLLEVLDEYPDVAAVAPRLLDVDGRQQEAGGLVGQDGFAGQLGLGDDPNRAEFRFRREIDFSSAAALLVRRSEFLAAGGFHPDYSMGYFEDVDLCLTLWDRGLSTVYEPRSTVVHLRGASGSEGLAQKYALANHAVLMRRWAQVLEGRSALGDLENYPHRLVAARDGRAADRVLFVTTSLPATDESGGESSVLRDLVGLWPHVRFTLLVSESAELTTAAEGWLTMGLEVAVGEDWRAWLTARRFHYSCIVSVGPEPSEELKKDLSETQPQALRAVLPMAEEHWGKGGGRHALVMFMAGLGVAPPEPRLRHGRSSAREAC